MRHALVLLFFLDARFVSFVTFRYQCQCNWLSGKICLRNDLSN